jgi:gluconate 2-dehydrogenase gamma chain
MEKLTRRSFFKAAGATAAALTAQAQALARPGTAMGPAAEQPGTGTGATQSTTYLFFRPDEARFIEAATERLIPRDPNGPGALDAGVPSYIDRQMAGAWGAGERLYRGGPWQPGTPSQGYQLPLTPAELFRTALRAIRDDLGRNGGAPFEQLPGPQQDAYLTTLQTQQKDLGGVPSKVFFESLLAMTIEGYFSDPVYGGNKDMAAWAMIGFPGAYGSYYDRVDQYGVPFDHPPRSLAQTPAGHVVVDPNIPATAPARPAHKGH